MEMLELIVAFAISLIASSFFSWIVIIQVTERFQILTGKHNIPNVLLVIFISIIILTATGTYFLRRFFRDNR